VQIKLKDLDTRIARIEKVVSNQSLLGLSNDIETLRADVRAMHNDIDQLNHALDISGKQQRDLYADLDRRLRNLEARGAGGAHSDSRTSASGPAGAADSAAAGEAAGAAGQEGAGDGSSGAAATSTPGGSDTASYQAAFALLKEGQYDKAVEAFQHFLATYPDSAFADNAQYWLGEAYYVNKSFPEALSAFQRVADKYPQSRKLPDALLKVGYCDYELGQWSAARNALSKVVSSFPESSASHLAKQRLDKMAAEKH